MTANANAISSTGREWRRRLPNDMGLDSPTRLPGTPGHKTTSRSAAWGRKCTIWLCRFLTHRAPAIPPLRARSRAATCTRSSTRCRRRSTSIVCCARSWIWSARRSIATPAGSTSSIPTTARCCFGRWLALVEGLSDLARAVSSASTLEDLLPAVARHAQRLLEASCCYVLIAEDEGGRLLPGAVWPADAAAPRSLNSNELGIELALSARAGTAEAGRRMAAALWGPDVEGRALVVPMVAADELVGALALRLPTDRRIDAEQREI